MAIKDLVQTNNSVAPATVAAGRGFEQVDMSTITMPRAKLMQPGSPELQDEDYNFKQGQLIHSLLMEQLPDKFIPISIWDSQILLVPREDAKKKELFAAIQKDDVPGFIVCRALDGKQGSAFGSCRGCALRNWRKMADGTEKPPLCTSTINVLALFEGHQMPVVLQFANTSYKHGKKFRDMAFFSGGDLFSRKYKIAVAKRQEAGNTWYEMSVKPAGLPTEEERQLAEALYERFRNATISTEVDEPTDTVEAAF